MKVYLYIEIEEHFDNPIELSCNMTMQDDSFDHEFGIEYIVSVPVPDGKIEYNKQLYSDMECYLIDDYIYKNYDAIIQEFCEKYIKQLIP